MALKPIEKGESTSFGEKEAPERQVRCLNRLMEVLLPPAAREFLDSGFVTFPLISTRRFNSPGESMFAFVRELSSSSE